MNANYHFKVISFKCVAVSDGSMTYDGNIFMHPSGDFVGSLAGNTRVDINSGNDARITWTDPSDLDLNLPESREDFLLVSGLADWIIK